jgi:ribosomal-protein-serine acetyltransferase
MFSSNLADGVELRILEERHAPDLFAAIERNRERLREWLPWVDRTHHDDQVREFIASALEQYAAGDGFHAAIWVNGNICGAIGMHAIRWEDRNVSIGYWLDAAAEGKGIMTRCVASLLDHLFTDLKLHRVEIRCGTGNRRSCSIPERLGFTREGIAREAQWVNDRFIDLMIWSMLQHEWRAKPQ